MPDDVRVRTGQGPTHLEREEFGRRFRARFFDPAFDAETEAVARLEAIAWEAYDAGRKSPRTRPAGDGFADPDFALSCEWLDTRDRLAAAAARHADRDAPSRLLVVCGASRNDRTCPGEASKTFVLVELVRATVAREAPDVEIDVLDLSLLASEYGRTIHPCKACVSTAMPLCNWPCSCYPNHSLGQVNDWMAEIYERWTLAHGILLVTPVYWDAPASPLKLMMDRLVCADGGNPDPTRTHGKDPARAKALELAGWGYPKHLAGRAFGVIVHGDVSGAQSVRQAIAGWLSWMGLVPAGSAAELDRYVGYWQPYATSHDRLDEDAALHAEVRNAARALVAAVARQRRGALAPPDAGLTPPRRK